MVMDSISNREERNIFIFSLYLPILLRLILVQVIKQHGIDNFPRYCCPTISRKVEYTVEVPSAYPAIFRMKQKNHNIPTNNYFPLKISGTHKRQSIRKRSPSYQVSLQQRTTNSLGGLRATSTPTRAAFLRHDPPTP